MLTLLKIMHLLTILPLLTIIAQQLPRRSVMVIMEMLPLLTIIDQKLPRRSMIVLLEVLLVDLPRQLTRRSVFVSPRDSPAADDHRSEAHSSQRDRSPRGASH